MWSAEVTHVSGDYSGRRLETTPGHCSLAVSSSVKLAVPLHDCVGDPAWREPGEPQLTTCWVSHGSHLRKGDYNSRASGTPLGGGPQGTQSL